MGESTLGVGADVSGEIGVPGSIGLPKVGPPTPSALGDGPISSVGTGLSPFGLVEGIAGEAKEKRSFREGPRIGARLLVTC